MKKRVSVLLAMLMAASLALTACGGENTGNQSTGNEDKKEESGDTLVLRLGHVVADESSIDKTADELARLVEEKSNGTMKIEVYPNSELGDNTALSEQVQMGTLDMAVPSIGAIGGFSDATAIFDLPYLFLSEEAAEEVLDGEIGADIAGQLEDVGFEVLSYWWQGWRYVTCNNEVHKPEDLKGIKIRTMDSKYHMAHFNALGASATPMAFSEVYTALQQGTIDAEENPYTNIITSRFYEVQKYIIETGHIYDICPLMLSKVTYDKLTDEQKDILSECAKEACEFGRDTVRKGDEEAREVINGTDKCNIIELTDDEKETFVEAVQPVYEEFYKEYGDEKKEVVDKINEINAKY